MQIKPTGGKGRRLTFRDLKEKGIRESRMTLWRRVRDKEFPEPIVDHGRTYWFEDEIDAHVARLENMPRGPGKQPPPKKDKSEASDARIAKREGAINEAAHQGSQAALRVPLTPQAPRRRGPCP